MMATWQKKCRGIRCLFICLERSHLWLPQTSPCEELQLTTSIVFLETLLTHWKETVDDCLKSLSSEAAAIMHVHDLQALLSRGGFKLTKWLSNSRKVIEASPAQEHCAELKKLDSYKNKLPSQRVLGLQWCVESDTFTSNICLRTQPFTRRGILAIIGNIFDPLGFVVPCCAFHPKYQTEPARALP